jgi:hypothetical protein
MRLHNRTGQRHNTQRGNGGEQSVDNQETSSLNTRLSGKSHSIRGLVFSWS